MHPLLVVDSTWAVASFVDVMVVCWALPVVTDQCAMLAIDIDPLNVVVVVAAGAAVAGVVAAVSVALCAVVDGRDDAGASFAAGRNLNLERLVAQNAETEAGCVAAEKVVVVVVIVVEAVAMVERADFGN